MGEAREAQEGGDVCIVKADSHCCMAETNTTLEGNYPPIKKKKEFCSSKFQFPRRASLWAAVAWSVFVVEPGRQKTPPETGAAIPMLWLCPLSIFGGNIMIKPL